jgi:hypothetical protein
MENACKVYGHLEYYTTILAYSTSLWYFWVNFRRVLHWELLVVYYMAIWSVLRPFGILYGHLVYFMTIR